MVYDYFDKYVFTCEMYDKDKNDIIQLVLYFYPFDNSMAIMNTLKNKKLLKRTKFPSVRLHMLQIGSVVYIFSKLLHITGCAPATRRVLFYKSESTFALIKPVAPIVHGKIITYIMQKGFQIKQMRNGRIDKDLGKSMFASAAATGMMPIIIDYVTTGDVVGLELVAPEAIKKWRQCLGATDPAEANPGTLRYLYGEDKLKNAAHGCDNVKSATEMLHRFFGKEKGLPNIPFRATYENCTCCIIKPHAIVDNNLGAILEHINISGKFNITAMAMFVIQLADAEEFYEIYKGVLQEYDQMCLQLVEGSCVVMEVKAVDPTVDIVSEFRKLCGNRDPDVSRQLYPDTLRAHFGKDMVQNAVHCTELPEDGVLEVEFFFKLVANKKY